LFVEVRIPIRERENCSNVSPVKQVSGQKTIFFQVTSMQGCLVRVILLYAVAIKALVNVPWNGRFDGLNVSTLQNEYLLHILEDRYSGKLLEPSKYITVRPNTRSSYNKDTGVAQIKVDALAIFQQQRTFRRSELVQQLNLSVANTTLQASFMKDKPFTYQGIWEIFFDEGQLFQVRVDTTKSPPVLSCNVNLGVSTIKAWTQEFRTGTWYNLGIHIMSATYVLLFNYSVNLN